WTALSVRAALIHRCALGPVLRDFHSRGLRRVDACKRRRNGDAGSKRDGQTGQPSGFSRHLFAPLFTNDLVLLADPSGLPSNPTGLRSTEAATQVVRFAQSPPTAQGPAWRIADAQRRALQSLTSQGARRMVSFRGATPARSNLRREG